MSDTTDKLDRYHRQMLLPHIGREGQQRLRTSHALLVGCGALGTVIADGLVRAGIGQLTLIDRDIVEMTNLQRQILFDEDDVRNARPKAEAARRRLARINSDVKITAHVEDFNPRNSERFFSNDNRIDVILDGLDNFETRYLLNDLAIKHNIPYIYGGAVGTTGMSMIVQVQRPNESSPSHRPTVSPSDKAPCLRCVFPDAPPPGTSPTCDTAGVLGAAVMTIAAHQVAQALKLLTGNPEALDRSLLSIDMWTNDIRRFDVSTARNPDCPCCGQRNFEHLHATSTGSATALCGRHAVQIASPMREPGESNGIDFTALALRLAAHGSFTATDLTLHGQLARERSATGEPIELILFKDGRAIVRGTDQPELARSIYARYVGL